MNERAVGLGVMGCTTAIIYTVLVIVAINWDRITYEEMGTCYSASKGDLGLDPLLTQPIDEPLPKRIRYV